MSSMHDQRLRALAAFAAVYVIWGSTYLAIRIAIETIPPILMAGTRFLLAGSILYAWDRFRGGVAPNRDQWRSAFVIGALLVLGGNTLVVWAEQLVPSGLTALLVATEPLWIVVLLWAVSGERPTGRVTIGLLLGLLGVAALVGPARFGGGQGASPLGAAVVVLAALSWAAGSLYARTAPQPASHRMGAAAAMLAGGAIVLVVATILGEPARLLAQAPSGRSLLAMLYLVVFGSLVGFSAYLWLMRNVAPARASTYAYVNPVVAVFLGWGLAGEPLNARIALAGALILAAVWLIVARAERQVTGEHPLPDRRRADARGDVQRAA